LSPDFEAIEPDAESVGRDMSDPNHPQDQQSVLSQGGGTPLTPETPLDEEIQLIEKALDAPIEDRPVAPSDLESTEDIETERGRRTVRRERLEDQIVKEELEFKKKCFVAILGICGLIAGASTAVIAAAMATHTHTLLIPALGPLFGSGGLSVGAWRIYVGSTRSKPKPPPTGESP
jgi:hypothetical protein